MLAEEVIARLKSDSKHDLSIGVTFAAGFSKDANVLLPILLSLMAKFATANALDQTDELIASRALTSSAHLYRTYEGEDKSQLRQVLKAYLQSYAVHASNDIAHHAKYALAILESGRRDEDGQE